MADTTTEAAPAPEPAPPIQQKTRRGWAMPLVSALVIVAALVVGGIGGFAIAHATGAAGRPGIQQGQFPGGPGGPGDGGQQGPRPEQGGQQGGSGQD